MKYSINVEILYLAQSTITKYANINRILWINKYFNCELKITEKLLILSNIFPFIKQLLYEYFFL